MQQPTMHTQDHFGIRTLIKKYEFWHPRVFEAPYYLYLGWQCLINGVAIKNLAKANYALDHGEIGIGSKLASQMAFNQKYFLPSVLLGEGLTVDEKKTIVTDFVSMHGFPVILKSDVGCVGKGLTKLDSESAADRKIPLLMGDFILQKYTSKPYECGIFYIRQNGQAKITGINKKHFPSVSGNAKDDLLALAKNNPRYTQHWDAFLQDLDLSEVLADGEQKRLSFIGSHTLGCKFTDDTNLLTPELESAIFTLFENQQGFNFGRVDVKSTDQSALQRGEFVVIEVNGVASLPTHMFDPKYSVWQAYKIFFKHAKYLVKIAKEHMDKPMALMPYRDVIAKVKANQSMLNNVHQKLMGR